MIRRRIRLLSILLCMAFLTTVCGGIAPPARAEQAVAAEVPAETQENAATEAPATATPEPIPEPTTEPAAEPTPEPTAEPTDEPVADPTAEPTAESTAVPSPEPSPETQAPAEETSAALAEAAATPTPAEQLEETVRAIVLACEEAGNRTKFDKALWLHDDLIERASLASSNGENDDAEAVLLHGAGTPAAFARAYGALLSAAGIQNAWVTDLDDEDVVWNVVRLDGEWYHVCVALDKTSAKSRYGYFCVTDSVMARAYRWDGARGEDGSLYPTCTATADNYFVREKGYAAFSDQTELDVLLDAAAQRGDVALGLYCAGTGATAESMARDWLARNPAYSGEASSKTDWLASMTLAQVRASAPPDESQQAQAEPAALARIVPAATVLTIGVGESASVAGWTVEPAGANAAVTYASGKSSVAKVSKSGVVTGKRVGTATVVIRDASGIEAAIQVKVKKAPSKITARAARTELGVGEETRITVTLTKGSAGAVTYTSSDEAVATVDADGVIRAVGVGGAKITATTFNGKRSAVKITVANAPEDVSIQPLELSVAAGDTERLAVLLSTGSVGVVTYISDNPSILTVDESGRLLGLSEGETTVRATTYNGLEAACSVEVVAAPQTIAVVAERTTLGVGEKLRLGTSVEPSDVDVSVSYFSSKSSVASVSAVGVVTAKRTGTVIITVRTYNGVSAAVRIQVIKAPAKIAVKTARKELGVGEEMRITTALTKGSAGAVTYTSSNEAVATVDADGVIRAVGAGGAKITAKTYNNKKAALSIAVLPAPESVTVSPKEVALGVGQTQALACALSQGSAGGVTYASSDETVATVDPNTGRLTAVGEGQATITATAYNGVSDAMVVTVLRAPEWVKLEPATLYIGLGESRALSPLIPDGSVASFTYVTSAKKYVKVSGSGVIKGVKAGKAKITVKTYNGMKAAMTVTVLSAPTAISLEAERLTLGLGESGTLRYALSKKSASDVTAVSANSDTVSVGEGNLLTAVGLGETVVTYTTFNGKKDSCTVSVVNAPAVVSLDPQGGVLGVGQTLRLTAALDPGSASALRFESSDGAVLSVAEDGLVTAGQVGAATVSVYTYVEGVHASEDFTVLPAPVSIALAEGPDTLFVNLGETCQLHPLLPEGTAAGLIYASSDEAVFTVDQNGLITPVRGGEAVATVTAHNGVSARVTVRVFDPQYPYECTLVGAPAYLEVGESYTPEVSVTPSTADPQLSWSTSDARIARVDAATGVVEAVSHGAVVIKGKSGKNQAIVLKYTLVVLSDDRCLVMPERRTGIDGIAANLKRIDRVRESAFLELEELSVRGAISGTEYTKRKSIINNAFAMYSFPWMTLTMQPYWRAANSEGGAKNFQPGTVYYGLPYINSPVANRRYNVTKAVGERRYTDSGAGYYLLNRDRLVNGLYCGNDCSSFVSMAIWGVNSSHSDDKTWDIAVSSAYKTVSASDLRPGDLIDKGNKHVVMFLYYADAAHTQMVIIEQGGAEAAINTCSTSIRSVAYYINAGYVPRRLKSF